MEDKVSNYSWHINEIPCKYYGLFDGHGGIAAADRASRILHFILMDATTRKSMKISDALVYSFIKLQNYFETVDKSLYENQGTTAVVVLIYDGAIYCANAGDSRAISLSVTGKCMPLSYDHKPNNANEKKRITTEGGFVSYNTRNDVSRVWGDSSKKSIGISTSRGLGDLSSRTKEGSYLISPIPDITVTPLLETKFIIMACDGVWDVMSNSKACSIAKKYISQPSLIPMKIANEAYNMESTDNISVIFIPL